VICCGDFCGEYLLLGACWHLYVVTPFAKNSNRLPASPNRAKWFREVCKTFMRRFDPGPRLQTLPSRFNRIKKIGHFPRSFSAVSFLHLIANRRKLSELERGSDQNQTVLAPPLMHCAVVKSPKRLLESPSQRGLRHFSDRAECPGNIDLWSRNIIAVLAR